MNRQFSMDNFASGSNANYMESMHEQWEHDPSSVHASWNAYFSGMEEGVEEPFQTPPTLGKNDKLDEIVSLLEGTSTISSASGNVTDTANVYRLVRAYYSHGHLVADIDPLELQKHYAGNDTLASKFRFPDAKLKGYMDYKTYGFTEADLDRTFYIDLPNQGAIMSK